jgi:hypothetical protein
VEKFKPHNSELIKQTGMTWISPARRTPQVPSSEKLLSPQRKDCQTEAESGGKITECRYNLVVNQQLGFAGFSVVHDGSQRELRRSKAPVTQQHIRINQPDES